MTWSSGLSVTADGTGVVAHAGAVAVRLLADRVGLTGGLSTALTRRSFRPVHDRGRVLVDLAVLLADGGEAIADIDVLRHQDQVLGPVASAPTVWRALDELTPAALRRVETRPGEGPPARVGAAGRRRWAARLEGRRHRSRRHDRAGRGRHLGDGALARRSRRRPRSRAGSGTTPSACGATTARRCSPRRCGRGTPAPTPPPTTSPSCPRRSPRSRPCAPQEAAGPRGRRRRLARAAGLADRSRTPNAAAAWSIRSGSR